MLGQAWTDPAEVSLPSSLWAIIEDRLKAAEREEVRHILGNSRLERNELAFREVAALLEILREYRATHASEKPTARPLLKPRGHQLHIRQTLMAEIKFFIDELSQRSVGTNGTAPIDSMARMLKSAATEDHAIYDYVRMASVKSSPTPPRPPSSGGSGRSVPDGSLTSSRDGSSKSFCSNPELIFEAVQDKLNAFDIDQVILHLQQALDDEYEHLMELAAYINRSLDDEHEIISSATTPVIAPSIEQLRSFGSKLQKQLEVEERILRLPTPAAPRTDRGRREEPSEVDLQGLDDPELAALLTRSAASHPAKSSLLPRSRTLPEKSLVVLPGSLVTRLSLSSFSHPPRIPEVDSDSASDLAVPHPPRPLEPGQHKPKNKKKQKSQKVQLQEGRSDVSQDGHVLRLSDDGTSPSNHVQAHVQASTELVGQSASRILRTVAARQSRDNDQSPLSRTWPRDVTDDSDHASYNDAQSASSKVPGFAIPGQKPKAKTHVQTNTHHTFQSHSRAHPPDFTSGTAPALVRVAKHSELNSLPAHQSSSSHVAGSRDITLSTPDHPAPPSVHRKLRSRLYVEPSPKTFTTPSLAPLSSSTDRLSPARSHRGRQEHSQESAHERSHDHAPLERKNLPLPIHDLLGAAGLHTPKKDQTLSKKDQTFRHPEASIQFVSTDPSAEPSQVLSHERSHALSVPDRSPVPGSRTTPTRRPGLIHGR